MKLKLGDGLQIPIDVAGQALVLVGIRGSGKTNTAGVIAEELLDVGRQIVVLDPTDGWWGLRSDYPVFIFGGPHGDLPLNETDGKTLAEFVVQEKVPIILSLRHMRKGAQRRLVTEFCEELYHLKGKPEYREPLTVFIDESPQFVPQRVIGEMARLVGAVQDMILLGRNVGFGVVLISQRFATLNADVRTQADTVIVHRLPSPLDRKALTEWIEENATIGEQKAVLASLATLRTGEAWMWSPYFDLFKRAQIRARKTFDSSAAPKQGAPARTPKDLTKVDLEKLKGKLAATIEKAKADDPKELKRTIADLRKALAQGVQQADPKNEPIAQAPKLVLTDADRALLEKVANLLQQGVDQFGIDSEYQVGKAGSRLMQACAGIIERFHHDTEKVREGGRQKFAELLEAKGFQKVLGKLQAVASVPPVVAQKMPSSPASTGRRSSVTSRPTAPPANSNGHVTLGKCERAILSVLAQYPEDGATIGKLALLSVYRVSGGFRNSLAALRTQGLMDGDNGGVMRITDAGLKAAGGVPAPLDVGERREYWLSHQSFGLAERKILRVLIDAPHGKTIDQLAEATDYEVSGGFRNALASLRTAGVLVGKNGEIMRASDELFG